MKLTQLFTCSEQVLFQFIHRAGGVNVGVCENCIASSVFDFDLDSLHYNYNQ